MFALSETVETATESAVIRLASATRPVAARRRVKTFGTSRFGGRVDGFSRGRPDRRRRVALPGLRVASTLRPLRRRGGALRRSFSAFPRRDNVGTKRPTGVRREPNNRRERRRRRRRDNARTPLRRRRGRRRRSRNRVGARLPGRRRRPTSRNARGTAKNAPRNRGRKGILGTLIDFGCKNGAGEGNASRAGAGFSGKTGLDSAKKKRVLISMTKPAKRLPPTALRTTARSGKFRRNERGKCRRRNDKRQYNGSAARFQGFLRIFSLFSPILRGSAARSWANRRFGETLRLATAANAAVFAGRKGGAALSNGREGV